MGRIYFRKFFFKIWLIEGLDIMLNFEFEPEEIRLLLDLKYFKGNLLGDFLSDLGHALLKFFY